MQWTIIDIQIIISFMNYSLMINWRWRRYLSLAILLGALLAGCASTGNIAPHSRPIDPAQLEQRSTVGSGRVATTDDSRWWQAYGDPQLDALVDAAIVDNPSLRITADRIAQAQSLAGSARAGLLPQLNGKGELTRLHSSKIGETPPPLNGTDFWDNNLDAALNLDLDLWGRNRSSFAAAIGELRAAELDAQQARLALETSVVRTYLQLSYGYAVQDVLTATVLQRQQVLDITNRRHAAGLVPQLLVSQAEAELPPVQLKLDQTGNRLTMLRNQLAALSGQGPAAGASITRPQVSLAQAPALPETLPAVLLGHRADVIAARWRIEAAGKGIDAAKAQFLPNVNLMAFVGLQSLDLENLLSGDALTYGAGPAITLPLFDGGHLRANLAGRTAAYNLAIDRYNQTLLDALREVADQLATLASTERQRQQADAAVLASRRAYDQARQGFDAGLTDYLTVLSTQTALLNQQQELAQIVAAQLDTRATLAQALGGGFTDDSNSAAVLQQSAAAHPVRDARSAP
jgi:NodT family efflux transporter outer membrane factor (OMF) lipoprotein